MKAIQINEHGSIEVLKLSEIDEPECVDSKVKIKIKACAINHLDIWVRKGFENLILPLPLILGSDASGTIVEKGKDVENYNIGDDVVIQPGTFKSSCEISKKGKENYSKTYGVLGETENGVQAEYVVLDPINIFNKPEHLSYIESSSMQLVFMTAHQMIVDRAELQAEETILIYGATSGVGSAAIQIAKDIGAKVVTTVGDKNKVDYAYKMGADYVVLHNENNFDKNIKEISKGWAADSNGIDVVFEHIGFKTWNKSLRILNKGGRIVTCGATTGSEVAIDLTHLFIKQLSILGSTMSNMTTFENVMMKINNKNYKPFVDKVYNFNDIKDAHRRIENREHIGKVVLVP